MNLKYKITLILDILTPRFMEEVFLLREIKDKHDKLIGFESSTSLKYQMLQGNLPDGVYPVCLIGFFNFFGFTLFSRVNSVPYYVVLKTMNGIQRIINSYPIPEEEEDKKEGL